MGRVVRREGPAERIGCESHRKRLRPSAFPDASVTNISAGEVGIKVGRFPDPFAREGVACLRY